VFRILWIILALLVSTGCTSEKVPTVEKRSFAKIYRIFSVEVCRKKDDKCVSNKKGVVWSAQGSAAIVEVNSLGSFLLTAEHVCNVDEEKTEMVLRQLKLHILGTKTKKKYLKATIKFKVVTPTGQSAYADVINTDPVSDLCIIFAEGVHEKPLRRFYGSLEEGQRVYNIASPADLAILDIIPIFEGFFVGQTEKIGAMYSIPATGGSSGSPILDDHGRLEGMIHSVAREFHHVSFSPDIMSLNRFIDMSIEDYRDKWHRNMLKLTRP